MLNYLIAALSIPTFALLSAILLSAKQANKNAAFVRRIVNFLASLQAAAAVVSLAAAVLQGPIQLALPLLRQDSAFQISFYFDGVSTLMLTLVAIVGWVICRFSVRYLDGEDNQGNYFRWTAVTIGAVSLFVISGNLALMVLALLLTSIGLHQLLVHYGDRPAARRAAGIKFFFSRLGDLCLVGAAVLLFGEFGTLELPDMFAAAATLTDSAIGSSMAIPTAACLLGLCAVFKSAQFPFHTWLPETMESPTPVSALMHAGIVNAGGYLLVRMSPIVSLSPTAMWGVAGIGAFTAIIAAVVMLPQTSVKRSLAWSTIAQMGFMMLQCGLGAFSAAMLHIVAHSLYKAHAFLSSGSVMTEAAAMASTAPKSRTGFATAANFIASAATIGLLFFGMTNAVGLTMQSKPGGYLLGLILCMGLTRWMWLMMCNGPSFVLKGMAVSAGLILTYVATFLAVDGIVATSLPGAAFIPSSVALMFTVGAVFAAVLLFELLIPRHRRSQWSQQLYVHASNGFYVDTIWRHAAKAFSF